MAAVGWRVFLRVEYLLKQDHQVHWAVICLVSVCLTVCGRGQLGQGCFHPDAVWLLRILAALYAYARVG